MIGMKTVKIFNLMENQIITICKMAIATMLAWEIAKIAGSHHPYLAPISVILCLQTTINQSIKFSFNRMTGTVIGILITALVAPYFKVTGWTLGVLVFIGALIAKWLKTEETALHQSALTVLLVFLFENKPGGYPIDRFRDTLIGAISAVAIHMILFPPNFTIKAVKKCEEISSHLSVSFSNVSVWLKNGMEKDAEKSLLTKAKEIQKEIEQSKVILQGAADSLKYNPFIKKSKKQLQQSHQQIHSFVLGCSYLLSVIQTLIEWKRGGSLTPSLQNDWANQLQILSSYFQKSEKQTDKKLPAELVAIKIPEELKIYHFHCFLYHETLQLAKSLTLYND